MKKKVKKIPKYSNGTPYSTAEIDAIANQMKLQMDLLGTGGGLSGTGGGGTGGGSNYDSPWKNMDTNQKISTGIETLGAAGSLLNTAMSGQDVTVGGAISATALGAAAGAKFGGPIGAIGGALFGLAAGTAGRKRGVDYTTGTADMGSGWMKMFGPSKDRVLYKANMARNSMLSQQRTQDIQADYYNENPTGSINMTAAEGGIMRRPVNALVSKGELIYDPTTKKLRQVPGSKGKPNKADDVFAKLYEGDVVISNSPTMLMANGKTPAQNLMGMVDKYATGGTVKAREAIIKKVVNWLEANKTKPQEYAMYGDGTGEDGVESKPIKKRRNSIWNRIQDKWNASAINDLLENYYNNIDKYEDHAIIDGRLFIKHDGKWYDSHKGGLGRAIKGNVLPESGKGYMTDRYQTVPFKQGVFADVDKSKIVKHKKNNTAVSDIVKPNSNIGITTNPELDFVSFRHVNSDHDVPESDIATTVNKTSSGKKTTTVPEELKRTPEQIAESLRIEDIGERHWLRGPVLEQPWLNINSGLTKENAGKIDVSKIPQLTVLKPGELDGSEKNDENTGSGNSSNNWQDALYRMAVLSQPLWDRAKAEPVKYTMRNANYLPVYADPVPLLNAADLSYAIGAYNARNLSGGQNMAYKAQLAADRAKQYADAHKWQQEQQNKIIAQNVGIYNEWDKDRAATMNSVYDKTAANKATARNINKQNRAAALSNWGTILRDNKQFAADSQNRALQTEALKPLIQSVYENSDTLIPMLAQYTANKNIKKKQNNG